MPKINDVGMTKLVWQMGEEGISRLRDLIFCIKVERLRCSCSTGGHREKSW